MTREQIYNLWAPTDSPWSLWAKPVLFAHLPAPREESCAEPNLFLAAPLAERVPQPQPAPAELENRWPHPVESGTAIVVDLPGRLSVVMGLSLAVAGYRPVPLFNAVPGLPNPIVDVRAIAVALIDASARLASLKVAPDAPPAFLLDHDRRRGVPQPGDFDNRSISLPTDFPSAGALREHGITRILVIQPTLEAPQNDVAHTLRRWQDAGIPISIYAATTHEGPQPWHVERPRLYKAIWHNLLVMTGLRRNLLGGFGGVLPLGSAG
jgi:hypothetical protein